MSTPRVFVSYVQENRPAVVQLVHELRKAGISVWFDQDALPPGVFWRDEIMAAVRRHDYFIACFSAEFAARDRTYMNEELELAVEELRQRSGSPWFIPVLLSGGIPDRQIGASRSLRDIQYIDLANSHWSAGIASLISTLRPNPQSNLPAGGRGSEHRSDRLTALVSVGYQDTSPAEQQPPNIQLVQLHVCSAELVVGQAIREVRGNAPRAIPAYVAYFRNDPIGTSLGIPTNIGAKISFVASDFTITAMGMWIDHGERTTFPVGVTRRLWLVAMPTNSGPLTVEPSGTENMPLHHQMLRSIKYRCEFLLFDTNGVQIMRVFAPLELPF